MTLLVMLLILIVFVILKLWVRRLHTAVTAMAMAMCVVVGWLVGADMVDSVDSHDFESAIVDDGGRGGRGDRGGRGRSRSRGRDRGRGKILVIDTTNSRSAGSK